MGALKRVNSKGAQQCTRISIVSSALLEFSTWSSDDQAEFKRLLEYFDSQLVPVDIWLLVPPNLPSSVSSSGVGAELASTIASITGTTLSLEPLGTVM